VRYVGGGGERSFQPDKGSVPRAICGDLKRLGEAEGLRAVGSRQVFCWGDGLVAREQYVRSTLYSVRSDGSELQTRQSDKSRHNASDVAGVSCNESPSFTDFGPITRLHFRSRLTVVRGD
jgi:hypothetical protein